MALVHCVEPFVSYEYLLSHSFSTGTVTSVSSNIALLYQEMPDTYIRITGIKTWWWWFITIGKT